MAYVTITPNASMTEEYVNTFFPIGSDKCHITGKMERGTVSIAGKIYHRITYSSEEILYSPDKVLLNVYDERD